MRVVLTIYGVIVFLLFGLFFWRPLIGRPVTLFFVQPRVAGESENQKLIREIVGLKAELALYENLKRHIGDIPRDGIVAAVAASYPFGFKKDLVVRAGSSRGVEAGMSVFFGDFLIGQIDSVFFAESRVRTIFDPQWRSVVTIGTEGADALLIGGNTPSLTLINKNAIVTSTEAIYFSGAGSAFGAPMGTVRSVWYASDKLSQEADIQIPYDIGLIDAVTIVGPTSSGNNGIR